MIVVSMVDRGREQVHIITDTAEPITFPFPGNLVAFKLDSGRVGSIRRIKILRSAPNRPESVEVQVALADSFAADRLGGCLLVVDQLNRLDEHTSFRCVAPADTAGMGLAPFGSVMARTAPTRPWPLLARATEIAEIQAGLADGAQSASHRAEAQAESIATEAHARADSIRAAAEALADSMVEAGMQSAERAREGGAP
jgi:hypothetical protein